jgi:hypothetical protein
MNINTRVSYLKVLCTRGNAEQGIAQMIEKHE